MGKIGIFYGSTEGNTENVAIKIQKALGKEVADLHNVLRSSLLKLFFSFRNVVPFVQIDKGRNEKKMLTAFKNKVFKPLKTTHERYADVFA